MAPSPTLLTGASSRICDKFFAIFCLFLLDNAFSKWYKGYVLL